MDANEAREKLIQTAGRRQLKATLEEIEKEVLNGKEHLQKSYTSKAVQDFVKKELEKNDYIVNKAETHFSTNILVIHW